MIARHRFGGRALAESMRGEELPTFDVY